MPTINIFYRNERHVTQLKEMTPPLKDYIAEQLTCKEITLNSGEVSVRLLQALVRGMLANVELDITAAPYAERVERQDEICLNVRQFVLDHITGLEDAQVWLNLHELGHSRK